MQILRKVTSQTLLSALLLSSFATARQPAIASQTTLPAASPITQAWQSPAAPSATLLNTYTLTDTALGPFQNLYLTGTITNDRKINLGGIGSDLWRGPNDPANEFWMITDRGPNQEIISPTRRTFSVPSYTPFIVNVRATPSDTLEILNAIPITSAPGVDRHCFLNLLVWVKTNSRLRSDTRGVLSDEGEVFKKALTPPPSSNAAITPSTAKRPTTPNATLSAY
jgi:hypothetical protein